MLSSIFIVYIGAIAALSKLVSSASVKFEVLRGAKGMMLLMLLSVPEFDRLVSLALLVLFGGFLVLVVHGTGF